ncbi:MAG: hypothetical protein SWK76_06760 [Actinomycetota bacterium]|nr:hypothetical protein [Actinomycetota bacterium]
MENRRWKWYYDWYVLLGIALVLLSVVLYVIHFAFFRDSHHIFIYMLGDLAFLPVEVLLVTLIVHRLLDVRERRTRMEKLNMVIGAFFSEMGSKLLQGLSDFDTECAEIENSMLLELGWTDKDFLEASRTLQRHECRIGSREEDLEDLRDFLNKKRDFLLTLLENPNLLEHETFTDLLWSVFHLTEELDLRDKMTGLPEEDMEHICGDIGRAYSLLLREWLGYMKHLKQEYPYLYSLNVRMNPFNPEASPVVQ